MVYIFRNYSCELIYYFTYHYISVYINITALTIQYHRGDTVIEAILKWSVV